MSAINNALSELSKSQTVSAHGIEKIQVPAIKQKPRWPWLIGGFSLSLAMGGWAISQQESAFLQDALTKQGSLTQLKQPPVSTQDPVAARDAALNVATIVSLPSPTAKVTHASDAIYNASVKKTASDMVIQPVIGVESVANNTPIQIAKTTRADRSLLAEQEVNDPISEASQASQASQIPKAAKAKIVTPQTAEAQSIDVQTIEAPLANVSEQTIPVRPVLLARNSTNDQSLHETNASDDNGQKGVVVVEQVDLTPTQLAQNAQERAKKALDANNLKEAMGHYNDALRYTPRDSKVRQRLAALYYGKGDPRKAVELLQKGISLDIDDMSVRLSLSKLLLKEQQNAAALTPLVYLPPNPSLDYLSLRAALAQKNNQDALALESYQQLVVLEPDNGRWWLGYGIQLERAFELQEAKQAYQHALNKVGLSNQSQQFIRDRLGVLSRLEEQPSAD